MPRWRWRRAWPPRWNETGVREPFAAEHEPVYRSMVAASERFDARERDEIATSDAEGRVAGPFRQFPQEDEP
jgi:hypothetical protein